MNLRRTLTTFIQQCLSLPSFEKEAVQTLFPSGFHPQLQNLLSALVASKLPSWREASLAGVVGLPKYRGVEWSINLKSASNAAPAQGSSVPSAVVRLQLEKPSGRVGSRAQQEEVVFELSPGPLQVMLEGLGKIKDQLQSIAG
eukprot:GAFH01005662.1.p1 GENE.GAFH01005662.1~~GAFH01005662.1.p1  ORF type:complete len:156 (-),score=13.08 GAFH01005662.1:143-571(-)